MEPVETSQTITLLSIEPDISSELSTDHEISRISSKCPLKLFD